MSRLTNRNTTGQGQAVSDAGQLEPVEPAYYKSVSPSPIASQLQIPAESTTENAPVVLRGQNMRGMRYLWNIVTQRQPLSPLGQGPDIGIAVNSSQFQPDLTGPHKNAGFNDRLFQAGYPGFNLGLSFKVQQSEKQVTGPGANIRMKTSNITNKVQVIRSSNARGVVG